MLYSVPNLSNLLIGLAMNSIIKKICARIIFCITIIFCFFALPSLAQEYEKIPYGEGYILIPAQPKEPAKPSLLALFFQQQQHDLSYQTPYPFENLVVSSCSGSNYFPESFNELRKRTPLVQKQVYLPWQLRLINYDMQEYPYDSCLYPTKADRNNPYLQKSIQFWECQQILRQNLFTIAHGTASERMQAFFDIAHKNVPCSNADLYEKGLKKLIDKFCSWDRSEKKYHVTKIPYISYEESQTFFQEYLDLFPQDWRIVRYNLKSEYIEKICNAWQMVQKGHEIGGKHNTALIHICKQDSVKSLYDYYAKSTMKHDPFIANFYKTCISERYAQAHQESAQSFSVKNDPLYTSNNHELLLLRKEYADKALQDFAPLQNIAAQDIFAAIPQNIFEVCAALNDPNNFTKAIDSVLHNIEKNHSELFMKNGVLCTLHHDSYVQYMRNETIEAELAHIINYGLLIQKHDAAPEGVKELAKKTIRLARLATNKDHVNYTNRMILAHTSYELLKHAHNDDLILHTMTEQARATAHQNAIAQQEYREKFYEERKKAFEQTEAEHYKQFARKYELHEDTVTLLCKEDLCPLDFENLHGTNLQHELMAETIEGLDTLAILNKHAQYYGNCGNSFQNTVSTLTLFAQAAQEFNSECDITASTHCINTLHSGLEIIVEGAHGIGIGLENLGNIVLHPIETGKSLLNFTKSIAWGLQETARYCLFDRIFDQNRACKTESLAQDFLEGVANHIYYSYSESSPGDYARIAAQQYTMLKAPGALLDAVCSGIDIAKNSLYIQSLQESEISLLLKHNKIDKAYIQIASEITEDIKISISELAQTLIPNINEAGAFIVKTVQEVKDLASKFTTQWQTINEILPTLTDANLRPMLKNEEFVNALAQECTHLARLPNAEYLANIKSQYPQLIEIFKKAELPEIIAQHVPNGFSDEQIIPLLDHLFDITIAKGRSGDKKLLKAFGGHANIGGLMQNSEILQFLEPSSSIIIDGFYNKMIAIKTPLGTFTSYKTYFPNYWGPEKIIQTILDKLKEADFIIRDDGILKFEVNISTNLFLEYFFNKETKMLDSVFPVFKL